MVVADELYSIQPRDVPLVFDVDPVAFHVHFLGLEGPFLGDDDASLQQLNLNPLLSGRNVIDSQRTRTHNADSCRHNPSDCA